MKYWVILSTILFSLTSCQTVNTSNQNEVVAASIGRIVLYDGKIQRLEENYETGGFTVIRLIKQEHNDYITKLSVDRRVVFFWAIMMHIPLDGTFLEELYLLIHKDCGKEFVKQLELFLVNSNTAGINGIDQKKARMVQSLLKSMS